MYVYTLSFELRNHRVKNVRPFLIPSIPSSFGSYDFFFCHAKNDGANLPTIVLIFKQIIKMRKVFHQIFYSAWN